MRSLRCLCFVCCFPLLHVRAEIRFADVTAAAGLTYTVNGEGVCIFDYDADGLEDIFIANFSGRNLLYHNLGNLTFEEVAASAGVDSTGRARVAVAADYDADGFPDLVIGCHEDQMRLFHNSGDGTFADVTGTSGISNFGDVRGAVWFDYENDGLLDMYVSNAYTPNILCRNLGGGLFEEIASSVNAEGPMPDRLLMGLSTIDYDRDGDLDFFMAQDGFRGNILLRRDSSGMYTDVSEEAGIVLPTQGMGVGVGDYNRDGLFDVYITNLDESTLFRNNGDGTFEDVTQVAGVGDQPGHMGWGTFFFDADNDGWLDLYNNNQSGFGQVPNSFYHNLGDGTFEDLSAESGLLCWNDGIGSAYADLDNDGDLDIVLAGYPAAAGNLKLFKNISDEGHAWIQLTLRAGENNYDAIGATVELYTQNGVQTSQVAAGNGYASQNTLRQHFGLGSITSVDSIIVAWPDGSRERFNPAGLNAHYVIEQGTGTTGAKEDNAPIPSGFSLGQNYPNPFNPITHITFVLPVRTRVVLKVYDILGRLTTTLIEKEMDPGTHSTTFSAAGISNGIYLYRMEASRSWITRKMILMK